MAAPRRQAITSTDLALYAAVMALALNDHCVHARAHTALIATPSARDPDRAA